MLGEGLGMRMFAEKHGRVCQCEPPKHLCYQEGMKVPTALSRPEAVRFSRAGLEVEYRHPVHVLW